MLKPDPNETHPTEAEIDEALKGSFPASDPPSWTLGIEQPDPPKEESDSDSPRTNSSDTDSSDTD